jgi:hypothetical protein
MNWRWIDHNGQRLYDVAVLSDGSLHNPNRYDEAVVRDAVREAEDEWHARRREAAKKAAATRQRRQEARVYEAAKRLIGYGKFGQRRLCYICRKPIDDYESIARGIGNDCWQQVLEAISKQSAAL